MSVKEPNGVRGCAADGRSDVDIDKFKHMSMLTSLLSALLRRAAVTYIWRVESVLIRGNPCSI
jgi:hypothetical protein